MKPVGGQYTIRGVPAGVDRALRQVAKARHLSLNRFLVQELERIANQQEEPGLHHDLDFAIGSMKDGPQVDQALTQFSIVDESEWR